MRIWATALDPPSDKLLAENQFGKNLPHSKISKKELERSTNKLHKDESERKGKARFTKNTQQKTIALEQRQL